ncbi:MAG: exo-alpha-sialidase [Verrucomicrobiales bacterium]|nr:exo-alpha-sialidase [Verrucomicrobiales bacterium]
MKKTNVSEMMAGRERAVLKLRVWVGLVAVTLGLAGTAVARNAELSSRVSNLSEPQGIDAEGVQDKRPEVVAVGDDVHVFWFSSHKDGGHKVCYRRSLDRGVTWQPTVEFYRQDVVISDPVVSPYDQHLAVVDGTVHLVFGAYGGEGAGWFGQLVYLRSGDNGATFEEPRVMWASGLPDGSANSPWHAYNLRIGVADGKVAICYRRQPNWYDVLHAHVLVSDDLGVTFSDTAAATAGAGGGWDVQDFVFDGDLVAVMYLQQAYSFGLVRGDLYMAVSGDGGATFRPAPISVPTSSGTHKVHGSHDEHYSPVVAVDSGRVHAVWRGEDGADTMAIFYRRTTDAGVTWDAAQNLTAGTGLAPAALTSQCTVVADGDLVFAFIHTSAATLYLRKSVDGGASFGDLVEVTDPVGQSLAGDCWWPVAKRVATGRPGEVALDIVTTGLKRFRSLDDGETFSVTAEGPIWSLWQTNRPQFAVDGAGNTHVVCEGGWTWYSTGVFGDPDVMHLRLDAEPEAASGTHALAMVTKDNDGDGTGVERYDGMLVTDDGALLPREAVTIEFWAKSQLDTAGQESYYVEKQGPGAGGSWETVLIGHWRSGQADARLATVDDGYVLVGGESIVDGAWHHVALSYDSRQMGENMRLFVDGEEVAATAATGALLAGRGPLLLGADEDQRAEGLLVLDDVRVWDRALDGDAIRARKDVALTGVEDGLVAWYSLDGSGVDGSGNGHHGRFLYRESFVAGVTGTAVVPVPEITSATILNGAAGQVLSYPVVTGGEVTGVEVTGLPEGLSFDPGSGLISGTPTVPGLYAVTVSAMGPQGTGTLVLTVNVSGAEGVVFELGNIFGVLSGPQQATVFTMAEETLITYISDYHYFSGGVLPGTIALRHSDGTVFGPWQCEGRVGQGGVSSAYWEAWPMEVLPAGGYTVVDSSPATWSWNSQSDGRGFTVVRGIANGVGGGDLLGEWAKNMGLLGEDAEAEADPDRDLRPNWVEAVMGGYPLRANRVPVGLQIGDVEGSRAVSYRACAGGTGVVGLDHVVNGGRIVIEVSETLAPGSWVSPLEVLDVGNAERELNGDGTETVVVPFRAGVGGSRVFVRERLERVGHP